jgi:fatty-acyl-CoA synthase
MRLRQGYGLTEAGVNCFTTSDEDAAAYPDSVGRPMPHLSAAIRREDGNLCGPDEVGELTLSGRVICSGYYNAPEEWAQRYRDGWLWTGDLASQDRQGRYRIRGRRTEMYISGGENVYPVEVEQALSACRDVVDCAVLGVPHKLWGETGLAAVVLRPGAARDAEALRTELRTRLAGYKLPTHLRFYEILPRTGAGKLDKRELRRHYDRGLGPA